MSRALRPPRLAALAAALLALPAPAAAAPGGAAPGSRLVDVRSLDPTIRVELSYATPRNVFKRRFYRGNTALLREPVARRLVRVQRRLRAQGLGLKIWDAYRPTSIQAGLWRHSPKGRSRYLSNPRRGSKHSRGAAVDVTLVDREGREQEMPTPHDEFSPRAHRGAARGVSARARKNSRILEAAMRAEGFIPNRYEWWHFSAPDWRRHSLLNVPIPADPGPEKNE